MLHNLDSKSWANNWGGLLSRPVVLFFLVVLFVRLLHAYFSIDYHIDGDISLPWLMANDWVTTSQKRFFWGQQYMGTLEVWVLKSLGRILFGFETPIPFYLSTVLGQFFYSIGVTAIYAALCKIRPEFWNKRLQWLGSVLILGFAVPCFQKYSFGVGNGYTSMPIAFGLSFYLHSLLKDSSSPDFLKLAKYSLGGVVLGVLISVARLNAVPVLALSILLVLEKRFWIAGVFFAGLGSGLLPEVIGGMTRNVPSQFSFIPTLGMVQNALLSWGLSGVSLGLIPFTWFEGEHALWFRSHANYSNTLIWSLVLVSGLAGVFLVRRTLKSVPAGEWKFPLSVILVNLSLIALISPVLENFEARRYAFPIFFSFSIFILSNPSHLLNRALVFTRIVALGCYLFFSLNYITPLSEVTEGLHSFHFDSKTDCLAGHAGDLSPTFAYHQFISKVVDTASWRVTGNFSKALPLNSDEIKKECGRLFVLDTESGAFEKIKNTGTCESFSEIYKTSEKSRSFHNWDVMRSGPRIISIFECKMNSEALAKH